MIRPATPGDAAGVQAVYAPAIRDTAASFEVEVPSVDEMRERIAGGRPRLPWLVADAGGAVLGYAYASPHRERAAYRWSVDTSVYIAAHARRRGLATALSTELLAALAGLGYLRAHAGIALPNPASVALHESLGYRPAGVFRAVGFKHGRWHDVGWWQRPLADLPGDPPEPLPFIVGE